MSRLHQMKTGSQHWKEHQIWWFSKVLNRPIPVKDTTPPYQKQKL